MKCFALAAAAALGAALSGCATIIKGETETITVTSPPARGARCVLYNDDGFYGDVLTPGALDVARSRADLTVTCTKRGFKDATTIVSPHFNFVTFGNLGIGVAAGTIALSTGLAIDATSGANQSYPSEIEVPMEPLPRPPATFNNNTLRYPASS